MGSSSGGAAWPFESVFFLNGKGTLLCDFAEGCAFTKASFDIEGGSGGVPSSSSPSSGEELMCRLVGLDSGEPPAGRFADTGDILSVAEGLYGLEAGVVQSPERKND